MKLCELHEMVMKSYDWTALERDEWVQPVLITVDNVVIDGAHRTIAARVLSKRIAAIRLPFTVELVDPNTLKTWLDRLVDEDKAR